MDLSFEGTLEVGVLIHLPSTIILPSDISSSPAIALSKEVLPQPLGPKMQPISSTLRSKVIFFKVDKPFLPLYSNDRS